LDALEDDAGRDGLVAALADVASPEREFANKKRSILRNMEDADHPEQSRRITALQSMDRPSLWSAVLQAGKTTFAAFDGLPSAVASASFYDLTAAHWQETGQLGVSA
jgi:hypothetical protein